MTDVKKYRIISIEAEKLVHSQMVGGFSARLDGKPNIKLFSGILDYSLESEKLYEACTSTRNMSRKTYFFENGYDYTTAIINVKFNYTRHDFVSIGGAYVREGYKISDAFFNCSEIRTAEGGEQVVVAIKTHKPLDFPPLPDELLPPYFAYDAKDNCYVRRKDEQDKTVSFDSVEGKFSLREKLYRDGFDCDGVHYVRYKRSAGSSRTGQCLFIAEPLFAKMMRWSLCGLDPKNNAHMDLASFEAYVSLSLSSITDTIRIPKESILFMKDVKSVFKTHAVSVGTDENKRLRSEERKIQVENVIWDGEALLDASVFSESGYGDKGMMLLRNRFFKTCAFNTNLQTYFADNGITHPSQLCGYTQAKNIGDIKMIVTESSLKHLKLSDKKRFEAKVDAWLSEVDDTFGIVKTDKPTGFFEGQVVRTSYQLLNTLGLSRDETAELLRDTLDYYEKVRSSPTYMRNYINYTLSETETDIGTEDVAYFNARQKAILGCLSQNDQFANTVAYKEFRSTVLASFSRKMRSGKLLIKGTNATILGNGLELLAASVGKYTEGGDAVALSGEGKVYCKHFADGTSLLGCRSPHVTMGNLMVAENIRVPEIDRYFNLTGEIVYVNAIGCNIQQRLNGCDYDSDAMLLTDNALLVSAAKRNARFAVPVCSISSTRKEYEDSPEGKAELDYEISQNKIGEIINLSQLLNTLYWHNAANRPEENGDDGLYRDICILAVLSGMEIDKAKRNFDVATEAVLRAMTSKYEIERTPEFFKFIMYTLEGKRFEGETLLYDTTMDYLTAEVRHFIKSLSKGSKDNVPLSSFVKAIEENGFTVKSGSNDARDCEYIKQYVRQCRIRIGELRTGIGALETDEKYLVMEEIEETYRSAIAYVTEKLKNYYMLKYLLKDIDENFAIADTDDKKFLWILFETICLEREGFFYDVLSASRDADMYNLIPDESGNIEIYGVKHAKKLSKSARI